MALNSDSAAQLTKAQMQLVETMETRIDDWLSRKYSGANEASESFRFGTEAGELASDKVVKELEDRYRKAGWARVEINSHIDLDLELIAIVHLKR